MKIFFLKFLKFLIKKLNEKFFKMILFHQNLCIGEGTPEKTCGKHEKRRESVTNNFKNRIN